MRRAHAAATLGGHRRGLQPEAVLAECARVLRPGARYVILEFTTPGLPLVRTLYAFYFNSMLPRIGGLYSSPGGTSVAL